MSNETCPNLEAIQVLRTGNNSQIALTFVACGTATIIKLDGNVIDKINNWSNGYFVKRTNLICERITSEHIIRKLL